MKNVVSAVQTTGYLHIGNYIGSIKQWRNMQDKYNCYFFLADLHSITSGFDPDKIQEYKRHCLAIYLASGINPEKVTIFTQSDISQHIELYWLLSCITPIGWLKRMTQFKNKSNKKEEASTGLFTYPILQAADILLYNADLVPVGDDQRQHIELTRDIAKNFNRKFGKEIFNIPESVILDNPRIMSLRDGAKKMSKSDVDATRINLIDDNNTIRNKIKRARTDSIDGIITYDQNRPEIVNLINIISALTDQDQKSIIKHYNFKNCADLKNQLTEIIINSLNELRSQYYEIIKDQNYMNKILDNGREKAMQIAETSYKKIKNEFGI